MGKKKKSKIARDLKRWPSCQSVLGHKRLRSQHCPFSACHVSTVTHYLCTEDRPCLLLCLPTPRGHAAVMKKSFGHIGVLPYISISGPNMFLLMFSFNLWLQGCILNIILLSHITHLIFCVLKSLSSLPLPPLLTCATHSTSWFSAVFIFFFPPTQPPLLSSSHTAEYKVK